MLKDTCAYLFFVLSLFLVVLLLIGFENKNYTSIQGQSINRCPLRTKRSLEGQCKVKEDDCKVNSKYRTFTAQCNNLRNPKWGMKSRPLRRLLPSTYQDRKGSIKTMGVSGRLLNPRVISEVVHRPGNPTTGLSHTHTLTLMQWGQFLAHDLVKTPVVSDEEGLKLPCDQCSASGNFSSCEPVLIPKNDGYFPSRDKNGGRNCIPFTRSAKYQPSSGSREQFNSLTSYLDASNVYGSDPCHAGQLRTFYNGYLKMESHPLSPEFFKPLMPKTTVNQDCKSPSGECFFGGDDRSSEQPGLATMHLIFVREHNRLADQLRFLNPQWTDEILFQEARKIVSAMHQHITYSEFLPRVLGTKMIKLSGLDKPYKYNPGCNAEIYNEFATAAFRFGHSLIRSHFDLKPTIKKSYSSQKVFLRDNFFNIDRISRPQYIDELARGILSEPMAKFDVHMTGQLTNHLFEIKGQPFSGMDLAALNIQRGRDHGLQGYLSYLRFCTKMYFPEMTRAAQDVRDFGDLATFVGLEGAARLSRVYRDPEDVDLFTGGLSETSLEGGVVGLTFGCILAIQFQDLKDCDRFWYEADAQFTQNQLQEIRNGSKLSAIICRNMDHPAPAQPLGFDLENVSGNEKIPCQDHPHLNMKFWQESRPRSDDPEEASAFCDVDGTVIEAGVEKRINACRICKCEANVGLTCHGKVPERSCQEILSKYGHHAVRDDSNCQLICPELF